jgi:hypothetical protein
MHGASHPHISPSILQMGNKGDQGGQTGADCLPPTSLMGRLSNSPRNETRFSDRHPPLIIEAMSYNICRQNVRHSERQPIFVGEDITPV